MNKAKKSRKDSQSEDSESSSEESSSSSSSSEGSELASEDVGKKSKKVRSAPTEADTKRKQRQNSRSEEPPPTRNRERSGGGQTHQSKWDSPERRRHARTAKERSRSRQRERSRGRDRSRERERERRDEDRNERGRNERNDYGGRDRGGGGGGGDRRNFRQRDGREEEKPRGERYRPRDERDQRGGFNDRRDRSPRRERTRDAGRKEYSPPSHSRPQQQQRRHRRNSRDGDDDRSYEWGKREDERPRGDAAAETQPQDKEKPNFALSGALTEDTNKVNGVVVKYSEPLEARKPKRRWRLYPFKGETALPTLHIHRQSCFLVGRDRKVVDLAVDHPSCSKQHAALQYRLVPFKRDDGTSGKRVRLYLIDLESANGTFLNNKKIEARKYYELIEKDVIKFGFSTREYVLLHENSKEDQEDDDVDVKQELEPESEPSAAQVSDP